jgi:transcriptional regulator with XRE-family HTH domain
MSGDSSSRSAGHEETVGVVLARMRRAKNLTGEQLGRLSGLSQPTISRLERGQTRPVRDHIVKIAEALGARPEEVQHLLDLAERPPDLLTDWRPLPVALAKMQQDVGRWETEVVTLRVFQPAVVVGLLQTSSYARAVLEGFQDLVSPRIASSPAAISQAVSARIRRQEILAQRDRTFHFLMAETVLSNKICPPEDMLAQIKQIRLASRQDNISVGIIPADVQWPVAPLHGFVLGDEEVVEIDLFNTAITTRGRDDAKVYRQVFDAYQDLVVADTERLLDKYSDEYVSRVNTHNRS